MNVLNMPVWQMTGQELVCLLETSYNKEDKAKEPQDKQKKFVYGIRGIAELFDCSKSTANRIKQSGEIDAAIKQIGRKIIVDAELALELVGKKKGGRK